MIIFLYGQDSYRLKEKTKEIINHYQKTHKSGLNLRYFDFDTKAKIKLQDVQEEFRSVSMFGEKKLLVIKNIKTNDAFKKDFLENIKNFSQAEDVILFCEEGDVPPSVFLKSLKKYGKCQEFQPLRGLKLKNWIKKEFEKNKVVIDKEIIDLLADYVGNDLWQMSNEIKKLVNYKAGQKIEKQDVVFLVRPKLETDIFKTIDAIGLRDKKRALFLIHKHLEKGDSYLYLLAMIGFQFRNLLAIKSGSKMKMHPYVFKKTNQQAQYFSLGELKKIYRKLFEVDLDIKTGRLAPEAAFDLLIAEI